MAMKIERVTQRVVKPAVEGGGVSREWVALSSADFFGPPAHVELLLAFEAAPPIPALDDGLRKALVHYRELAGRILPAHPQAGRPAIQLNDAGAAFIEAQADGPLQLLLPFDPTPLMCDLLPPHAAVPELLLVQVTSFTCGGIVMGITWHHQVADAEAGIDFMNAWACIVRGQSIPFSSSQDRSILMARDPPQPVYDHMDIQRPVFSIKDLTSIPPEKKEVILRRLRFSGDLLKRIKEEAKKEGEEFTRFESLMGHLWKCITRARGLEEEEDIREGEGEDVGGETSLMMAVNARKRMAPKIESGYFGNVICPVGASANVKRLLREPMGYAARLVKEAIKKVGEEYVRSSLDFIEIKQPFAKGGVGGRRTGGTLSATPNLSVTSWATMPIYHINFGTGFPLFAGNAYIPLEGLLSIVPPPLSFDDGGLDVVLGLFAPAMDKLLSMYETII